MVPGIIPRIIEKRKCMQTYKVAKIKCSLIIYKTPHPESIFK